MTGSQGGVLLLDLALVLTVAGLAGGLFRRLGQPRVVGEILAGVLLGPSLLGRQLSGELFPADVRPYLGALGSVGVALFMFVVGLEVDRGLMRGAGRLTAGVATGSIVVPFCLGTGLAYFLARDVPGGPRPAFVLFVAVALSVTAFPVLARILADHGMLNGRTGHVALAAAAVGDLVAWVLLAVAVAVAGAGTGHWRLVLVLPYLAVLLGVVRPALRALVERRSTSGGLPAELLAAVLVVLLLSAAVTELVGLHLVFGAFLAGLVTPRGVGGRLREQLVTQLEPVGTGLLLPVYFVVSGLQVDLSRLGGDGVLDLVAVLLLATAGKFLGVFAGARLGGSDGRQAAVFGTLMNTRGLTELVVLGVGLQIGLLDGRLYSVFVAMAVLTTVTTGPVLDRLARRGTAAGTPAAEVVDARAG